MLLLNIYLKFVYVVGSRYSARDMTVNFIIVVTSVENNINRNCVFICFGKNLYELYNSSKQIKHFIGINYNNLAENYWTCSIYYFFYILVIFREKTAI